ncbi:putative spermidine/putrescine transport system substrate-binding protein [Devosia sp. UYZn731]|uniref:extracellular solute-binding protein n=1 Tax=Devosia sp. UYZn731 TaxID=3156345 RepID=UPI0033992A5F
MTDFRLNRRMFGLLAAGAAASSLLPSMARASGGLVAATFPGSWEDAYRSVLTPLVKAAGYDLTVAPALSQDQLTKVMASPGAPAFDTLLISPGQMATAIEHDLIVKIDPTRLKNWSKLAPAFQGEYGPTVTVQIDGIVYNPDLVPKPKGYRDLFENPAYAGLVSWTGFDSNTAVMAYTQIAKIFGTGPEDMDAVFKLFKDSADLRAGVTDTTNHQMALYQQGEIAVFMGSTNNVAHLKSLGLNADFVQPETGSPASPVNIHLTKGSANVDAAYAYMDAALDAGAQATFQSPPTEMFPTNADVELTPNISSVLTRDQVAGLAYPDWVSINKYRDEWTSTFIALIAS